jgi:hypothetical protein
MNEEGLRIDMQHQLIPNTSRGMSDGDTNPMHKRHKGWYNRRGYVPHGGDCIRMLT